MANKFNLANVNVGSAANDGSGDLLRDAFVKINDNFANIFGNGQFLANVTDTRGAPGYSWENDKNTGLYNPEDGVIIVSLNGTDSLHMRSNGYIAWRGDKLIGETQFNAAIQNIITSGGGALEFVETLPTANNFEGRFVLNAQDGQLYLYQNDAWILLKNQLAPNAPSGIEFVNNFPDTNLWEGRLVVRNNFAWVYRQGQWVKIQDVADIDEAYSKIESVDTLPTDNLFEGRTAFQNEGMYIYYGSQWRPYGDFIATQAGSVELAGSIKLWAGVNAPTGWHICDGTAVSRTVYATLFARIGTTYGTGNGTTTFNLPDFRDRTAIGVSSTKAIGTTGGFADAVVVQHSHSILDLGHNHVPQTGLDGFFNQALKIDNPSSGTIVQTDNIQYPQPNLIVTGDIESSITGIEILNSGVSGTGRNLPPYTTANWIIKLDDGTITGEGGVTSSGLFFNVEIYRRSATAVDTPVGGSFNFSTLTLTPPAQWSRNIPTGTDPVYVSKAIAYATNTNELVTNLTWSTPVIAFRDGTSSDGTDGTDGPRNSSGYLFYNTLSETAPTPPSSTTGFSFATGTFSTVSTGWSQTLSDITPESGKKQWAVRYYVAEGTFGGAQTLSLSPVFVWNSFDGVVTFTNFSDTFDNNITTIDGGKITTGTLEVDKIRTGTTTLAEGSFSLGDQRVLGRYTIAKYNVTNSGGWGVVGIKQVDAPTGGGALGAAVNSSLARCLQMYNAFRTDGGDISVETADGVEFRYRNQIDMGSETIPFRIESYLSETYADEAPSQNSLSKETKLKTQFIVYGPGTGAGASIQSNSQASASGTRDKFGMSIYLNGYNDQTPWYAPFFSVYQKDQDTTGSGKFVQTFLGGNFAGYALHIKGTNFGSDANDAAEAKAYIQGGVTPFTGIHEGALDSITNVQIGDIVIDDEKLYVEDIVNVRFKQVLSSEANQKGAIGIVSSYLSLDDTKDKTKQTKTYAVPFNCVQESGESDEDYAIRKRQEQAKYDALAEEYSDSITNVLPDNLHYIDIAAVGEGQINVCGEGGNIERGDLIVTSSIPGKGMKQADDIVRAYTVAKARESVTFDTPNQIRTIACVYLCG